MLKEYNIIFLAIALKDFTIKSTKTLKIFATFNSRSDF
jgi:hypothetical protein